MRKLSLEIIERMAHMLVQFGFLVVIFAATRVFFNVEINPEIFSKRFEEITIGDFLVAQIVSLIAVTSFLSADR